MPYNAYSDECAAGPMTSSAPVLPWQISVVKLINGWVGQVSVKGRIVWQCEPIAQSEDCPRPNLTAMQVAEAHVQSRLEGLFA